MSLANISRTDVEKPTQQKEDELGRLTRSLPLYFAESAYYWSDVQPIVLIPVVKHKGPAVFGSEWPIEHVRKFAEGAANTVIYGSVQQEGATVTISLRIWDGDTDQSNEVVSVSTSRKDLGRTVLDIERKLLSEVLRTSSDRPKPAEPYYVRPTAEHIDPYLVCLGQSLMMTLVQNEYVSKEQLWGERSMLDYSLSLALEMEESQVAKIQFLSCLVKSQGYDSPVVNNYKAKAIALLEDETDKGGPFYRLSPILFRTLGMDAEFRDRCRELSPNGAPPYREWLEKLQTEQ